MKRFLPEGWTPLSTALWTVEVVVVVRVTIFVLDLFGPMIPHVAVAVGK